MTKKESTTLLENEGKPSILIKLFKAKKDELEQVKEELPLDILKKRLEDKETKGEFSIRDFKTVLTNETPSLMAEIKKASPSAGNINEEVDIEEQARMYEEGGANAISVLTEKSKFKGDIKFLQRVKDVTKNTPVFRKDFIFDEYQIYESKYYGADAILLIAAMLEEGELKRLVDLTHELGMECLVETHTKEELEKAINSKAEIIGINARNLHTYEVNLNTVIDLASSVPEDRILIAESGVETGEDVRRLKEAGAQGVLVGTTLMKSGDVKGKIKELKLKL